MIQIETTFWKDIFFTLKKKLAEEDILFQSKSGSKYFQ